MDAKTKATLLALLSNPEILAELAGDTGVEVEAPATPRKRGSKPATRKAPASPKASAARTPKGRTEGVFTVRESWKGQAPSPRMIGACLYHGMTPVQVAKVQRDKYACALALGNHRVKAGTMDKVTIVA